jgi:hypothetical protein
MLVPSRAMMTTPGTRLVKNDTACSTSAALTAALFGAWKNVVTAMRYAS